VKLVHLIGFITKENEEMLQRVKKERNILPTVKRRKANWIADIVRRNCFLKHVTEGKIEGRVEVTGNDEEDVSSYWMTLRKRRLETGRRSTRSHSVENLLWNRPRTCHKRDNRMNERQATFIVNFIYGTCNKR
jgi:hypothetical protein